LQTVAHETRESHEKKIIASGPAKADKEQVPPASGRGRTCERFNTPLGAAEKKSAAAADGFETLAGLRKWLGETRRTAVALWARDQKLS